MEVFRIAQSGRGTIIDGALIKELRRRLGMTQRQLGERLQVEQGTISRWERGVEAPRPKRRAALQNLLLREGSRRAMLKSVAFVRQDYLPSTLLDGRLRIVEVSASGKRHLRERGIDPRAVTGMSLERYVDRKAEPGFLQHLTQSGLLDGDSLLFRYVRNFRGQGHASVYEPIFEDENLVGVLNYVTSYFELPETDGETLELIEVVRTDDPTTAHVVHNGPNADEAIRRLRAG